MSGLWNGLCAAGGAVVGYALARLLRRVKWPWRWGGP